jgi:hypothetical protein
MGAMPNPGVVTTPMLAAMDAAQQHYMNSIAALQGGPAGQPVDGRLNTQFNPSVQHYNGRVSPAVSELNIAVSGCDKALSKADASSQGSHAYARSGRVPAPSQGPHSLAGAVDCGVEDAIVTPNSEYRQLQLGDRAKTCQRDVMGRPADRARHAPFSGGKAGHHHARQQHPDASPLGGHARKLVLPDAQDAEAPHWERGTSTTLTSPMNPLMDPSKPKSVMGMADDEEEKHSRRTLPVLSRAHTHSRPANPPRVSPPPDSLFPLFQPVRLRGLSPQPDAVSQMDTVSHTGSSRSHLDASSVHDGYGSDTNDARAREDARMAAERIRQVFPAPDAHAHAHADDDDVAHAAGACMDDTLAVPAPAEPNESLSGLSPQTRARRLRVKKDRNNRYHTLPRDVSAASLQRLMDSHADADAAADGTSAQDSVDVTDVTVTAPPTQPMPMPLPAPPHALSEQSYESSTPAPTPSPDSDRELAFSGPLPIDPGFRQARFPSSRASGTGFHIVMSDGNSNDVSETASTVPAPATATLPVPVPASTSVAVSSEEADAPHALIPASDLLTTTAPGPCSSATVSTPSTRPKFLANSTALALPGTPTPQQAPADALHDWHRALADLSHLPAPVPAAPVATLAGAALDVPKDPTSLLARITAVLQPLSAPAPAPAVAEQLASLRQLLADPPAPSGPAALVAPVSTAVLRDLHHTLVAAIVTPHAHSPAAAIPSCSRHAHAPASTSAPSSPGMTDAPADSNANSACTKVSLSLPRPDTAGLPVPLDLGRESRVLAWRLCNVESILQQALSAGVADGVAATARLVALAQIRCPGAQYMSERELRRLCGVDAKGQVRDSLDAAVDADEVPAAALAATQTPAEESKERDAGDLDTDLLSEGAVSTRLSTQLNARARQTMFRDRCVDYDPPTALSASSDGSVPLCAQYDMGSIVASITKHNTCINNNTLDPYSPQFSDPRTAYNRDLLYTLASTFTQGSSCYCTAGRLIHAHNTRNGHVLIDDITSHAHTLLAQHAQRLCADADANSGFAQRLADAIEAAAPAVLAALTELQQAHADASQALQLAETEVRPAGAKVGDLRLRSDFAVDHDAIATRARCLSPAADTDMVRLSSSLSPSNALPQNAIPGQGHTSPFSWAGASAGPATVSPAPQTPTPQAIATLANTSPAGRPPLPDTPVQAHASLLAAPESRTSLTLSLSSSLKRKAIDPIHPSRPSPSPPHAQTFATHDDTTRYKCSCVCPNHPPSQLPPRPASRAQQLRAYTLETSSSQPSSQPAMNDLADDARPRPCSCPCSCPAAVAALARTDSDVSTAQSPFTSIKHLSLSRAASGSTRMTKTTPASASATAAPHTPAQTAALRAFAPRVERALAALSSARDAFLQALAALTAALAQVEAQRGLDVYLAVFAAVAKTLFPAPADNLHIADHRAPPALALQHSRYTPSEALHRQLAMQHTRALHNILYSLTQSCAAPPRLVCQGPCGQVFVLSRFGDLLWHTGTPLAPRSVPSPVGDAEEALDDMYISMGSYDRARECAVQLLDAPAAAATVDPQLASSHNVVSLCAPNMPYHELRGFGAGTIIALDIDDTIHCNAFHPCTLLTQQGISSFRNVLQSHPQFKSEPFEAKQAHMNKLQQVLHLKALVEHNTGDVVRELQSRGCLVIGLTSRYKDMRESTIRSLADLNIDLTLSSPFSMRTIEDGESGAYYEGGVIFTNAMDKGIIFNRFLENFILKDGVLCIQDLSARLPAWNAFNAKLAEVYRIRISDFVGRLHRATSEITGICAAVGIDSPFASSTPAPAAALDALLCHPRLIAADAECSRRADVRRLRAELQEVSRTLYQQQRRLAALRPLTPQSFPRKPAAVLFVDDRELNTACVVHGLVHCVRHGVPVLSYHYNFVNNIINLDTVYPPTTPLHQSNATALSAHAGTIISQHQRLFTLLLDPLRIARQAQPAPTLLFRPPREAKHGSAATSGINLVLSELCRGSMRSPVTAEGAPGWVLGHEVQWLHDLLLSAHQRQRSDAASPASAMDEHDPRPSPALPSHLTLLSPLASALATARGLLAPLAIAPTQLQEAPPVRQDTSWQEVLQAQILHFLAREGAVLNNFDALRGLRKIKLQQREANGNATQEQQPQQQ